MTDLPTPDRTAPAPLPALERWWVIYDGACSVCTSMVEQMEALDRRDVFAVRRYQDDDVRRTLDFIPDGAFEEALQVVAPDGRNWEGAPAVEVIVAQLPATSWAAPLFKVPGVRPLADKGYRAFARNRHRLGCGDHCSVGGDDA